MARGQGKPDQFDFNDTGLKSPPQKLDLAGFKLTFPLNRPDKFDEVIAFLGASYFRALRTLLRMRR